MKVNTMATINLKDFYPWYGQDEYVEAPNVVTQELFADRRYEKSHKQRTRRNKSFYSIDANDGALRTILARSDAAKSVRTRPEARGAAHIRQIAALL